MKPWLLTQGENDLTRRPRALLHSTLNRQGAEYWPGFEVPQIQGTLPHIETPKRIIAKLVKTPKCVKDGYRNWNTYPGIKSADGISQVEKFVSISCFTN